jgi:DNA-binding CsgD family transcriptional regulator/PAS domain-containing protein
MLRRVACVSRLLTWLPRLSAHHIAATRHSERAKAPCHAALEAVAQLCMAQETTLPSAPAADSLGSLIDAIYDAGLDAGLDARLWPEVLARIARRIGASHVNLSIVAAGSAFDLANWSGIDPDFARSYAQHFGALDPLVPQARRWPAGTLVTDTMIRPQATHACSEFVQEWVRPQRIHTAAFANVMREHDTAGILGALRHTPRYFDEGELDVLRALLPHLRHAVRVQRHIEQRSVPAHDDALYQLPHAPLVALDAFDALDSLAQCVLIVDCDARVTFANRAAAALLSQPHGLRDSHAGLRAPTIETTQRLHALIARASGRDPSARAGGALLIERAAPAPPLQVLISPLGATRAAAMQANDARRGTAMLVVIDPQAARRGVEQRLVALFALTPAEARVACEVGKGDNPRDIADTLQVLPSTVRTHLHHVFAKTATRGQADLMRLIAQLAIARCD